MSISRYRQHLAEQRMKVIIHEAARDYNRKALMDVVLHKEDGYYSLSTSLVGPIPCDIKTALLNSIHLDKLKNVRTICDFIQRPKNMACLDLDSVIYAINSRKYEAARLAVSAFKEKSKNDTKLNTEYFIWDVTPYNSGIYSRPHPRVLELDTVIFVIKNWNEELAGFAISVFLNQKDIELGHEKHQGMAKLKLILSNLHQNNEHFDKTVTCLFPVLDMDTVIFAIQNWDKKLARFVVSVFLHQNNEDIEPGHEKYQEIQQRKAMFFNLYKNNDQSEPATKSIFSFLNQDTVRFAIKNWDEELAKFIASAFLNHANSTKSDNKHIDMKLKTFFFQKRYDEREPAPTPVLKSGPEESIEERSNRYIR